MLRSVQRLFGEESRRNKNLAFFAGPYVSLPAEIKVQRQPFPRLALSYATRE